MSSETNVRYRVYSKSWGTMFVTDSKDRAELFVLGYSACVSNHCLSEYDYEIEEEKVL